MNAYQRAIIEHLRAAGYRAEWLPIVWVNGLPPVGELHIDGVWCGSTLRAPGCLIHGVHTGGGTTTTWPDYRTPADPAECARMLLDRHPHAAAREAARKQAP